LLKGNLGRERLLELLHDEIAEGTSFLRTQVQRSAGQETNGTTTLRAHGITAAQFTHWLSQAFGREDVLIAGHPEHYSIHPARGTSPAEGHPPPVPRRRVAGLASSSRTGPSSAPSSSVTGSSTQPENWRNPGAHGRPSAPAAGAARTRSMTLVEIPSGAAYRTVAGHAHTQALLGRCSGPTLHGKA
jgi:hypothetical protein